MIRKIIKSFVKIRRQKLPIKVSHADRTGMVISPNIRTAGKTMVIVGLNKELPTGSHEMNAEDIDWMIPVLEFADAETMELTAKALTEVAEKWKEVTE